MPWVENVPDSLGVLSLLNPSSVRVSNVAIEPPTIRSPVLQGDSRQAKRIRTQGMPKSGSRGGRRVAKVSREDVLGAISGLSSLHNLFVLGWCRLLREGSMDEFLRLAYVEGLERNNSFTIHALKDVRPVFWLAWGDLLEPCKDGKVRLNIGSRNEIARVMGCSASKAARFEQVYEDSAVILLGLSIDLAQALRVGLRNVA